MENNQREIKFRAWDKRRKKMLIPFTLWELFEDGGDFEYGSGSMFVNQKYDLFDREDYEFMQYIGLKDKNGKDIYEGDIVKFTRPFWDMDGNCERRETKEVVRFKRGWFTWGGYQADCFCIPADETVVIGNIYDNSELLENYEKQ